MLAAFCAPQLRQHLAQFCGPEGFVEHAQCVGARLPQFGVFRVAGHDGGRQVGTPALAQCVNQLAAIERAAKAVVGDNQMWAPAILAQRGEYRVGVGMDAGFAPP